MAESELVKRLLLPMEDDKRMPPKDQPQLTREEIELISWWIKTGADTKKKVKELSPDAAIQPVLASFSGNAAKDTAVHESLSKVFDANPAPASQAAIGQLTALGVIVSPVAKEKNLLEVSCINYTAFDNAKAGLLAQLADNIVWLRVDNTAITDDALVQIGKLKNLVRLNLSGTDISAAGLQSLRSLKNLEYINIVGTKADDKTLLILSTIPSLKSIYCWNSLITPSGVENFKKKMPTIHIESGSGGQ